MADDSSSSENRIRQPFNASDIDDMLGGLNHALETDKQMCGMRNDETEWLVETDDSEALLDELDEAVYELGADYRVVGNSHTVNDKELVTLQFEKSEDVEFDRQ